MGRAAAAARSARGIARRAQIVARPEDAEAMIALIEGDLERHGDLDLELSVVPDPLALVGRGDIFVALPGDVRAQEAEQVCGATVVRASTPDPLELDAAPRLAA